MKANKYIILSLLMIGLTACNNGGSGGSGSTTSSASTMPDIVDVDASGTEQYSSPNILSSMSVNPQLAASTTSCLTATSLIWTSPSSATSKVYYNSGTFVVKNTCTTAQQIKNSVIIINGGASSDVWTGGSFNVNSYTPWLGSSPSFSTITSGNQLQLTLTNTYSLAAGGSFTVNFGYAQNAAQFTTAGSSVAVAGSQPVPPSSGGTLTVGVNSSSLSSVCTTANACNIAINVVNSSNAIYKTLATITTTTSSSASYTLTSVPAGSYSVVATNLPSKVAFTPVPVSVTVANGTSSNVNSGFSVSNPVSGCLSASMGSVVYNIWYTSGTINLVNTCTTAQALAGTQIGIASSSSSDILNSSSFQLNSTSPYIANFASISGASNAIVLTANSGSGNIAANSTISIAFGYNGTGSAWQGQLGATVGGQTPVAPASLSVTVDSTGLSNVCTVASPCSIPIIVSNTTGYTKTLTTITTTTGKTVYNITGLTPGSYTLSANVPTSVISTYVPASSVQLASGGSSTLTLELTAKPSTTGTLGFTLVNPDASLFSSGINLPVTLQPSSGSSVSVQATLGQAITPVSLTAGTYTMTTLGLASASKGSYYNYPILSKTVAVNSNVALGNVLATASTASMASDTLVVNGLRQGDSVTLNFSDNKYVYNSELITAVKDSLPINTPYKFLVGDTITANVKVTSSTNTYLAVAPVTFTVANTTPTTYTINLTSAVKPVVSTVYSAYKDAGINLNWSNPIGSWNLYEMGTTASTLNMGNPTSLVSALNKGGFNTVTWAFATGDCSSEYWVGAPVSSFISANVNASVTNKVNYIVSTGGAAGVFTCGSTANMIAFAKRYMSTNLVGFDFDIEGGNISAAQLTSLINSIAGLQQAYPNLRISFTLPTLAASDGSNTALVAGGMAVMAAIKASGLTNYYINLMTMDYGAASKSICYLNSSGKCDMGNSAIQAAKNFMIQYPNVPASHVELTPLIGVNDIPDEIFSLADASVVTSYVKTSGLGGLHYWSFDRDVPCTTNITTTCSGVTSSSPSAFMFGNSLK